MEWTLREFENLNLYSNDSLQKIITSVVNSSSNAVLVNMFEDSLILLDHDEGQFYVADYNFDAKSLRLKIENFEPVELKQETDNFKEKVMDFFEDEDASVTELAENYKEEVIGQERYISNLINEAMGTKDFSDVIDWKKVKDAIDQDDVEELRKNKFFESYEKRLETHPLTEVKLFDWENPINVSLVDTEPKKLVNKTAVEKANDLWKKAEFKEAFKESASVLLEDVEEGAEKFKALLEDYPQVFYLDSADRKTLFGKTILSLEDVKDEMSILIKGLDLLFEKFDLAEMRDEYLAEADDNDEEYEDDGKEDKEKEDKEDEAPEGGSGDYKKMAKMLKQVAKDTEDEKAKEKLEKVIAYFDKMMEEGTRPDVVKEAVSILTL